MHIFIIFSDIGWTASLHIYRMEDAGLPACHYDGVRVYSVALDTLSFVGRSVVIHANSKENHVFNHFINFTDIVPTAKPHLDHSSPETCTFSYLLQTGVSTEEGSKSPGD